MRFLYSDNGTLSDATATLENYKSGVFEFSYVTAEDYIYLGGELPFNHFYLKMGTVVNAVAANMTIEYWDGREWIECVETVDGTNGLTASGFVDFVPDKQKYWDRESTNYQGDQITGLEGVVIYDLYWIRVSFSETLTDDVELAWIGNLFCEEDDIFGEYPIFNNQTIFTHFQATGKDDWEEQRVLASNILIKDMKSMGIIIGEGQILRRQDYRTACTQKTAQIIFTALGDDYTDQAIVAKNEYKDRLDLSIHKIDKNNNAILETPERFDRVGFLKR